ncbi:MAG: ornithine carbamoyltransferase [Candidatus Omnitrophota bacterium]|nr:ornithine carbamoyltransferase [Candidatus Omnitrophota bacterium]
MKHFICLKDFSPKEIWEFVDLAIDIKHNPAKYSNALAGKCVGLFFEKPSLRTKIAFYVGAMQLGGSAVYYSPDEMQLGKREKISDVARTVSHFMNAAVLRTFSHNSILEFAKFSLIPVINALSDLVHPSQILGDLVTIKELKGDIKKLKVAYVGDGNNVCHTLIYAFSILGGNLYIAAPKRYGPRKEIVEEAQKYAAMSNAKINIMLSPEEAVKDADVLYTDVWTSMGQERESKKRRKVFRSFQLNDKLIKLAKNDCIILHCLPAHRGEEITDSVIDGKNSVVFAQAENRLHAAKAVLVKLLSSPTGHPAG